MRRAAQEITAASRHKGKLVCGLLQKLEGGERIQKQFRCSWVECFRLRHTLGISIAVGERVEDFQFDCRLNEPRLNAAACKTCECGEIHQRRRQDYLVKLTRRSV